MKSKLLLDAAGERQWVLIFDPGDEAVTELKKFAAAEKLSAAHFTGIGAFAGVRVGWFDLPTQQYLPIEINEQVELVSLIGDVAQSEGKPAVHAHVCVAKRDGSAHGGHLLRATVQPTLELVLTESPAHLRKRFRPEYGIALIDLQKS